MEESTKKYTAYYRVSTDEQGDSGLGLLSQKTSVLNFITSNWYPCRGVSGYREW